MNRVKIFFEKNLVQIILITLIIIIAMIDKNFFSSNNIKNMLIQISIRIIIALGVGGIIFIRKIDFISSRLIALVAAISVSLLQSTGYAYKMFPNLPKLPITVVILLVMIVALIVGFINAVLAIKLKENFIIANMALSLILYGITSLYLDIPRYPQQSISGIDLEYKEIILGSNFDIPNILIYLVIICILVSIIWNKTKLGKEMILIRNNEKESPKVIILVYIIATILYSFAGMFEGIRIGSVTTNTGFMYEIDAILGCMIRGVENIEDIIIGVIILQVLNYGLSFIGVSIYIQYIIKGILVVMTCMVNKKYKNLSF